MFSPENDDIQMAIGSGKPFGINNPYNNKAKANKPQRDRIINAIIHNKYEAKGTDIIKIGGQLFLVDHTDAEDLYKSYLKNGEIPDGQGYGIRKKYTFAKLTKEDLYEITTNIATSYNLDETSLRNRLQELGVKPRNLSSIDFAAAIRAGNRNNGMGYGQSRRGGNQAISDTSSAIGRENQGEEFFLTPQGEIYGFIAPNGDMYLDETVVSPEHPIHEYTHL